MLNFRWKLCFLIIVFIEFTFIPSDFVSYLAYSQISLLELHYVGLIFLFSFFEFYFLWLVIMNWTHRRNQYAQIPPYPLINEFNLWENIFYGKRNLLSSILLFSKETSFHLKLRSQATKTRFNQPGANNIKETIPNCCLLVIKSKKDKKNNNTKIKHLNALVDLKPFSACYT